MYEDCKEFLGSFDRRGIGLVCAGKEARSLDNVTGVFVRNVDVSMATDVP